MFLLFTEHLLYLSRIYTVNVQPSWNTHCTKFGDEAVAGMAAVEELKPAAAAWRCGERGQGKGGALAPS